ncbi:MAG: EF-P lysine aminoacylase EpmA [Steroidobacteraceae bacterium]
MTLPRLRARARALERVRRFFAQRDVLEVQTGVLVKHAVSDPNIESFEVRGANEPRYLHTSPEYAMKRLLAEGSGDIYQLGPVFRAGERSAQHSPEFTLIEWYRLGFDLEALMQETAALVREVMDDAVPAEPERVDYRGAFLRELAIDPLECPHADLASASSRAGLAASSIATASRDDLLDFLVATVVGPRLGHDRLTCLHRYPASQASLARLDPQDARVALRFELYGRGVELANGFVELGDPSEQRRRFEADNALRAKRGQPVRAIDELLLAELGGLPPCAGVAVGFDRVLMLATDAARIEAVQSHRFDSH